MATNAGLIVNTLANQLVIDSEFRNPALRQKGSTATTTIKGGGSFVSFTVSGITSTPIIAVSSTVGATAHINTVVSGTATVEIICFGPVGTVVTWYIFDDPGVAAALHYMAVWNAAGVPVFNANEKYMKVAASLAVTAVNSVSVTLTAGRTYATYLVAPAARSVSFNSGGGPTDDHWFITSIRRFLRVNGAVIDTVEADVGQTGPYVQSTAPARYQIDSTAFILDVTNY